MNDRVTISPTGFHRAKMSQNFCDLIDNCPQFHSHDVDASITKNRYAIVFYSPQREEIQQRYLLQFHTSVYWAELITIYLTQTLEKSQRISPF